MKQHARRTGPLARTLEFFVSAPDIVCSRKRIRDELIDVD